eukprot:5417583-Alexandrium_andersonii.AAC.1
MPPDVITLAGKQCNGEPLVAPTTKDAGAERKKFLGDADDPTCAWSKADVARPERARLRADLGFAM